MNLSMVTSLTIALAISLTGTGDDKVCLVKNVQVIQKM